MNRSKKILQKPKQVFDTTMFIEINNRGEKNLNFKEHTYPFFGIDNFVKKKEYLFMEQNFVKIICIQHSAVDAKLENIQQYLMK